MPPPSLLELEKKLLLLEFEVETQAHANRNVGFHVPLFYWIFVPLIQHDLDEFRAWWNSHRVRLQPDKNMLSGHVPAYVFEHPSHVGGIDCRIQIPKEAVKELRGYLTEDVGSRDSHFQWSGLTVEFEALATHTWAQVGSPVISLDTAWDVFSQMSDVIEHQ
ncbi:hypothetical protein C8R45DRAFT_923707 [Mycena sanguinolenta]|nr:hypothetical protein C8R45DRAFT_923707 [Mycena sanguinolenta]